MTEERESSIIPKIARDELCEGAGAVADMVLFGGVQFAKGERAAARNEHWIVAETFVAARGPGQRSGHLAAKELGAALGRGKGEHGNKPRLTILVAEFLMNSRHRGLKILG